MKKFYQLVGLNKAIDGLFGIEIEAEGEGMRKVANKYWNTEDDGSLRGEYPESRAEFVMKKPVTAEEVKPALESLVKALEGAKFDFSYRTSVHVHVNVQELTMAQILNMVYTYLLLEEPLMTYCGKARKGNRFCLRLRDAEGMLEVLREMFRDENGYRNAGDNVRYSAINLAALNKYGSIEFRGMRGNIDVETIHTWTKILGSIREFATQHESPKSILALVEKLGAITFMKTVLGENFDILNYPRAAKDIASSFSLSLDLPYSYKAPLKEGERLKPLIEQGVPRRPPKGQIILHENRWYEYDGEDWTKLPGTHPKVLQAKMDVGLMPKAQAAAPVGVDMRFVVPNNRPVHQRVAEEE
jgi:hypothetical protein